MSNRKIINEKRRRNKTSSNLKSCRYAISAIMLITSIFICIGLIFGCQSNRCVISEGNVTESIIGNQTAVAKLEVVSADLSELHRSAVSRVESIREQSKTIGDLTDKLIFLFGEYESEVDKLLNEIDRIRAEAKIQNESSISIRKYSSDYDINKNSSDGTEN